MLPTSASKYEKLVRRLYRTNLYHPVKLGLDNILNLQASTGNPCLTPTSKIGIVHIAGTNGKGSVAYKIAKTLTLSGLKTGLFVSPHVSSFRERMLVNFKPISENEVEELLPDIYRACQNGNIPATFFELTTSLALKFFEHSKVDAIVLETGLGGRLDSTNIVNPSLSVITCIGLEHTRILGSTIPLIAREKGGIMKPGRDVLVGPNCPYDVLLAQGLEKSIKKFWTVNEVNGLESLKLCDGDDFDIQNSEISRAALRILRDTPEFMAFNVDRGITISEEAIDEGIKTRPSCRFELTTVTEPSTGKVVDVILDVAHNPPALKLLFKKLVNHGVAVKDRRVVIGMSSDKDLELCGKMIMNNVESPDRVHLIEASHPRAAKVSSMLEACDALKNSNYDIGDPSIEKQIASAIKTASEKNETLIVCGSFFLMARARKALGYDEPRDSEFINKEAGSGFKKDADLQEYFGNAEYASSEEELEDALK